VFSWKTPNILGDPKPLNASVYVVFHLRVLLLLLFPPDYEALLQQLQSGQSSSGDSFYVRVNLTLPAGPAWTLAVSCNDILHVTNTWPAGTEGAWHASQVHPGQLLDLQSGSVPNYYRSVAREGGGGGGWENPPRPKL